MKDRIKKIIESQHMTQQEFAECIKVAPATLSSIFTGRTAPSLKVVEAIKARFPNISTDWLMFGKGSMNDEGAAATDAILDDSLSSSGQSGVDFAAMPLFSSAQEEGGSEAPMASVATTDAVVRKKRSGQSNIDGLGIVNNCDKPNRRIAEIRIFYDDQTWETFVPKK